jgi:hypothetical protein
MSQARLFNPTDDFATCIDEDYSDIIIDSCPSLPFIESQSEALTPYRLPHVIRFFDCLIGNLLSRPHILTVFTHYPTGLIQQFFDYVSIKLPVTFNKSCSRIVFKINDTDTSVIRTQMSPIPATLHETLNKLTPLGIIYVASNAHEYMDSTKTKHLLEQANKRVAELEALVEEAYRPNGVGTKRARTHFETVQGGLDSE